MTGKAKTAELLSIEQLRTLVAIHEHVRESKVPPTALEVAKRLGVAKTSARQRIELLRSKGMLGRGPGLYRTVLMTRKGVLAANKAQRDAAQGGN